MKQILVTRISITKISLKTGLPIERKTIAEHPKYFKQRYQAKIDKKFGQDEYRLLGTFRGSKLTNRIKHSCGLKFNGSPESLMQGYTKCPWLELNRDELTAQLQQIPSNRELLASPT